MALEAGEQETGGQVRDADRRLVTVDSAAGLKFAVVNATADGDQTLVAAVASKKIRVIAYQFVNQTTAGLVLIKSSGGNVVARLPFLLGASIDHEGGRASPAFETLAGEGLVLNNAAGVDTVGHLTYVEVS